MHEVAPERLDLACRHKARRLARTMILKGAMDDAVGAGRQSVIVKAGALSGHPGDDPHIVVRSGIEPFVPAPIGGETDALDPGLLPRSKTPDDAAQRDGAPVAGRRREPRRNSLAAVPEWL